MIIYMAKLYMDFVNVAESVFTAFGWKDPGNIDLERSTKLNPSDDVRCGTYFFRY
jgi:hypothetical protein